MTITRRPAGAVSTFARDQIARLLDDEGRLGLYRLEVTLSAGTGKLRTPAGLERGLKDQFDPVIIVVGNASDNG